MSTENLYGLVLAGGKSQRMGEDKAQIAYHGSPHSEYLFELLSGICEQSFLSIRKEQQDQYGHLSNLIVDKDEYRGPFNGLLSAYDQFPDKAWLVVACDLPLIDRNSLLYLLKSRDQSKYATAFATKKSGLPEPLAADIRPSADLRSM